MKKYLLSILTFVTFAGFGQSIQTFATKSPLGNDMGARSGAAMTSWNNELYILAGRAQCSPKDFTKYNPATGSLSKLETFTGGCANPVGGYLFEVQDKFYFFNNQGNKMYDPLLDLWTLLPGTTNMNLNGGFIINGIIYLLSEGQNGFYAFDPSDNSMTQKANIPGPLNRRGGIAFEINGKGYAGGGTAWNTNSCTGQTNCYLVSFYEYDPATDTWSPKADIPLPFKFGVSISHNGKGYAGLGEHYASSTHPWNNSKFWFEYDPISDTWAEKQHFLNTSDETVYFPSAVSSPSIAKIGSDLYVFGGTTYNHSNIYTDNLYKYNFDSDQWSVVNAEMGQNRSHTAGFYFNNKIYVGGGVDSETLNDFWEYDIANDEWTQKTNIPNFYSQRSAVEINGKGYFLGGFNSVYSPQQSSLLLEYNPVDDTWASKEPFPAGPSSEIPVFAYNGKLYAGIGVQNVSGQNVTSFYIYNPLTDIWTNLPPAPMALPRSIPVVLGDNAYFFSGTGSTGQIQFNVFNLMTETWSTGNNISIGNFISAFTFNNKIYINHQPGTTFNVIKEFDTETGQLNPYQLTYVPFTKPHGLVIPTPNSVFFGFGDIGLYSPLGILKSNEWHELRFNPGVSQNIGIYKTMISNHYANPVICGTGVLAPGTASYVYDENGDLFAGLAAHADTNHPSYCIEINSIDPNEPYRVHSDDFGNGSIEEAMFLNKDAVGAITNNGSMQFYYTTYELNKFVDDFNMAYGANKTIDDIDLIHYWQQPGGFDHDPFNNQGTTGAPINGDYDILEHTISDYQGDKMFEITGNLPTGEIYAVLIVSPDLGVTTAAVQNLKLYPNPAHSELFIQLEDTNESILSTAITDFTGKNIQTLNGSESRLNIGHLSSGIYIIQIVTSQAKYNLKFIKQ